MEVPDVAPPPDPESERRLVVFVDDWNLRPEDRAQVLESIRDAYARAIEAGRQGGPGTAPAGAFGGTDPCSAAG